MKKILTLLIIIYSSLLTAKGQVFTELTNLDIQGIVWGSVDWGDYNRDGLLDFAIVGEIITPDTQYMYSGVYKNLGSDLFEETNIEIEDVCRSGLDWGDYNNDNYIDLVLTGIYIEYPKENSKHTKVYKNEKGTGLTEQTDMIFHETSQGDIHWGDYNNDAYLDILQTGYEWGTGYITQLYRNAEEGNFEEVIIETAGFNNGSLEWGDYNNDSYLDFIILGNTGTERLTQLYRNTGTGTFELVDKAEFMPLAGGSVEWGDYNNDGLLDVIMSGQGYDKNTMNTKIYKNNGNDTFSELTGFDLTGVSWSNTDWGDYDNDGLADIILTGWDGSFPMSIRQARLYKNNGDDSFTEQTNENIRAVGYSNTAWGDYDNDNDIDLLLTGTDSAASCTSRLYKNNIETINSPPNVITGLEAKIEGDSIIFSWDEGTDDNQPSAGLNYNIYIYEQGNDTSYVASPQAFPHGHALNGKRHVAKRGHIQGIRENGRVSWIYKGEMQNCTKYYWSVQSIDASFVGGQFAPEDSFVFDNIAPKIICHTDTIINIPQSQTSYIVQGTEIDPISYGDNCGIVYLENDFNNAETLNGAELPVGVTTITWYASDNGGQTNSCEFDVEVKDAVGVVGVREDLGIEVLPNPTTGQLTVISEQLSVERIVVRDVTGKIIFNTQYSTFNNQVMVDLTGKSNGVYYLSVVSEGKLIKTEKVVIKR